jgi:hypothetical protein
LTANAEPFLASPSAMHSVPVEFEPPGTFPEVSGYRGGGLHGLPPEAWADDTSMALALRDRGVKVREEPRKVL